MRIVDVLRQRDSDEDDDEGRGGDAGERTLCFVRGPPHLASFPAASSPSRSLLPRWFRQRRKSLPPGSAGDVKPPPVAAGGPAVGGVDPGKRLPDVDLASGIKHNLMAFNLGMGFGMAFLLVENANELKKMMDLRKQMKTLLKEIKYEAQRRYESSQCTTSDGGESATTLQQHSSSLDVEEPKNFKKSNGKNSQSMYSKSMNQMEAELHFELEKMEINLEGLELKQHKSSNEEVDSSTESSPPAWYDNKSKEKVEESHGVCAHELSRKLHELVQSRQRERIAFLEAALRSAEGKLAEKEAELSCWKNIAELSPGIEETFFSLTIK